MCKEKNDRKNFKEEIKTFYTSSRETFKASISNNPYRNYKNRGFNYNASDVVMSEENLENPEIEEKYDKFVDDFSPLDISNTNDEVSVKSVVKQPEINIISQNKVSIKVSPEIDKEEYSSLNVGNDKNTLHDLINADPRGSVNLHANANASVDYEDFKVNISPEPKVQYDSFNQTNSMVFIHLDESNTSMEKPKKEMIKKNSIIDVVDVIDDGHDKDFKPTDKHLLIMEMKNTNSPPRSPKKSNFKDIEIIKFQER